jgi:hypothetical protein
LIGEMNGSDRCIGWQEQPIHMASPSDSTDADRVVQTRGPGGEPVGSIGEIPKSTVYNNTVSRGKLSSLV